MIFYVFFSTRLSVSHDLGRRFGRLTLGSPLIPWVIDLSYWLGLTRDEFFFPSIFNGWRIKLHYLSLLTKKFLILSLSLFFYLVHLVSLSIFIYYLIQIKLTFLNHSNLWFESHIFFTFLKRVCTAWTSFLTQKKHNVEWCYHS